MEGKTPFLTGRETYSYSDADPEEEKDEEEKDADPTKKKKKNLVSQLWNSLFSKESDKPKKEHEGFLRLFGTFFNKFAEVEQNEINEPEADKNIDNRSTHNFKFSLFGSIDAVPATSNTGTIDELTSYPERSSSETSSNLNEQSNDSNLLVDEPIVVQEHVDYEFPTEPQDANQLTSSDSIDSHDDKFKRQQETLIQHDEYFKDNDYDIDLGHKSFTPKLDKIESSNKKEIIEREKVIEKRDRATPLGMVMAVGMSKSRDKKIQAEAKQLEKKVENLQKIVQKDTQNIEQLRSQNRQQIEQLWSKRELKKQTKDRLVSDDTLLNNQKVQREAENSQIQITSKLVDRQLNHKNNNEYHQDQYLDLKQSNTKYSTMEFNKVSSNQSEKTNERDYIEEQNFERHEVKKGIPLSDKRVQTQSNVDRPTVMNQQQSKDLSIDQQKLLEQQKNLQERRAYKLAAKQGVMAGIIVLVSFAIIVLLWSLFN